jgi:hypothetical protein
MKKLAAEAVVDDEEAMAPENRERLRQVFDREHGSREAELIG